MINVKDQIYRALCSVVDPDNVSDIYPSTWASFPAIQYSEEANIVRTKTDAKEQLAYLRFRVTIWDRASTSETAIAVDDAVSALGLTRIECQDIPDSSGYNLRCKQMRYEGTIDVDNEIVYWEGSR